MLILNIDQSVILLRVYPIILWHQEKKKLRILYSNLYSKPTLKKTHLEMYPNLVQAFQYEVEGRNYLITQSVYILVHFQVTDCINIHIPCDVSIYTSHGNSRSKALNTIWIFPFLGFFLINTTYLPLTTFLAFGLDPGKVLKENKDTCSNTL